MSGSERSRELRRRRHRKQKINHLKRRVPKASASEKVVIASKIRKLTPGAETILGKLGLDER